MLSRVADSLYWMSRNIERAENNARALSVQLVHMLEASDQQVLDRDWEEILEVCASVHDYYAHYDRLDRDTLINYLTINPINVNSLANCMKYARENAKSTRDNIPDELWQVLNKFHLEQKGWEEHSFTIQHTQGYIKHMINTSMTAQGIIESSMTRGNSYTFIKVAKWLERAEKTARILNVVCEKNKKQAVENSNSYYYWLTGLQLVNGYDAYIKEHPPTMHPAQVLSFLIDEPKFPRSIRYCMNHVLSAVNKLEKGKVSDYSEDLFQILSTVEEELNETNIEEMNMEELMRFLDHFQDRCHTVSRIFTETYYLVEPVRVR
ncbi:alpha-E domain-containing protein [Halobacillus salinarum]|uniref:Alpha-E domain-containing protein n=1 Tax=Halobacillus salinarum TaxID=2932257 RepID=A0ABY4ELA8_9BACI|nr:alpha-E domain-containing protein [Halobacillus salinarum]UOQ45250.1 alpha-E domain-containing protein [Halobacillus salinarum]